SLLVLHSFPTRRSSDLDNIAAGGEEKQGRAERRHVLFIELLWELGPHQEPDIPGGRLGRNIGAPNPDGTLHQRQLAHNIIVVFRSEEHTSELQSREKIV